MYLTVLTWRLKSISLYRNVYLLSCSRSTFFIFDWWSIGHSLSATLSAIEQSAEISQLVRDVVSITDQIVRA